MEKLKKDVKAFKEEVNALAHFGEFKITIKHLNHKSKKKIDSIEWTKEIIGNDRVVKKAIPALAIKEGDLLVGFNYYFEKDGTQSKIGFRWEKEITNFEKHLYWRAELDDSTGKSLTKTWSGGDKQVRKLRWLKFRRYKKVKFIKNEK